jgi:hypothetical protein
MSEKQFEPCSLGDATHVEMGGKMYEFGDGYLSRHKSLQSKLWDNIEVKKGTEGWQLIHVDAFPILGIKPLKEKKQEPIVFEFIPSLEMAKDMWLPADFIVPMKAVGKKFKCVEILEDEE